jgi:gliding motility-associated-like protein
MRSLLFSLLLLVGGAASAQMVGGNAFLQGAYLEIGVDNMGALGACSTPAGYHPHTSSFGTSTNLAEVYDYGHDGWTVGSPAYMGDYTIPGVPSEGWSIQIGATEYRNWATSTACTGTFQAPGTITGYTNAGGNKIGVWTGTAGGATGVGIIQEARVDTLASAVVFTVHLKNLGSSPTGTIYYERMCDPDNTSSWSPLTGSLSGSSVTVNLIEHQNEDASHRVVVSATGTTYSGGTVALPYTYMAYGTKDCRAKACVLTGGLYPSSTPAAMWGGTGVNTALGYTNTADVCITLLYNLGPLAAAGSPGDTTSFAYTMFFDGAPGIDTALADPVLSVNSVPYPGTPVPNTDIDTLRMCDFPTITVFNADVWQGDSLQWAGSTWTWAPTTGLSSTTGTHNTIDGATLLGPRTYTITGTKTVSCLTKTYYLTVIPCNPHSNFTYAIHHGCSQDTVVFANTSTGGTQYTWNFGDGTPPVIVDTLEPITHVFTTQAVFDVSLSAFSTYCNCSDVHHEFVDTRHSVVANFDANNDTLCITQSSTMIDLSTTTMGAGVGQINAWAWDFADGSAIDNATTPVHTFTAPGIYPVKLTVTDSIGCMSSKTTNFVVWDLKIVNALTDTTLCLLQPLPLYTDVQPTPNIPWTNYSYMWTPADSLSADNVQVPSFMGYGTFVYTVTAYLEPYHCPATHTVTVHSVQGAKLMGVTHSATIPYGTSIQLYSSNELLYMWSPNDGSLTDNNINNPVATPTITTTYSVYGMDVYGCRDTAYVTVTVDSTMSEFIPSGFTPNGDGRNDQFRPVFQKYQKLVEFSVFNRWGQKVFSTSNKDEGWDGTFNGTPQDMGVYFFSIITSRPGYSENQVYKGEITLIR